MRGLLAVVESSVCNKPDWISLEAPLDTVIQAYEHVTQGCLHVGMENGAEWLLFLYLGNWPVGEGRDTDCSF